MAVTCRCPSGQTTFSSGIPVSDPRPAHAAAWWGCHNVSCSPDPPEKALSRQKKDIFSVCMRMARFLPRSMIPLVYHGLPTSRLLYRNVYVVLTGSVIL